MITGQELEAMTHDGMVMRALVMLDREGVWPVETEMQMLTAFGESGFTGIGLVSFYWGVSTPTLITNRATPNLSRFERSGLHPPKFLQEGLHSNTIRNLEEVLDDWTIQERLWLMYESVVVVYKKLSGSREVVVRSRGHMVRMDANCEVHLANAARENVGPSTPHFLRLYTKLFERLQGLARVQAKPLQQLGAF